jgi:hypothetical protein
MPRELTVTSHWSDVAEEAHRAEVIARHAEEEAWEEEERLREEQAKDQALASYVDEIACRATSSNDPRVLAEARDRVWAVVDSSEVFWDGDEPYLCEDDEEHAEAWARDAARATLLGIARRDGATGAFVHEPELVRALKVALRIRHRGPSRQERPGRRTRATARAPARSGDPPPSDPLSRPSEQERAA